MLNPRQLHIPPEILDHTVDFLRNQEYTLKQCCIVSKSWVPRARKHIFSHVEFGTRAQLESWKRLFPNGSSSPAWYTRSLSLSCPQVVTTADAGEDGWIRAFSCVTSLLVHFPVGIRGSEVSLVPLHGFSPVLKSLRVLSSDHLQKSQIFGLISTLPHLDDLSLIIDRIDDDASDPIAPPIVVRSSPFTGTLKLSTPESVKLTARWLLDLPDGIRFRRLLLSRLREGALEPATALLVGCSSTLESLVIVYRPDSDSSPGSIDLSSATKLKDATFMLTSLGVQYVTRALQTITSEHRDFRRLSIRMPYRHALFDPGIDIMQTIEGPVRRQWLDLDRVLTQFCDSRSIRPKVYTLASGEKRKQVNKTMGCLLPEAMKRGIIDLFEWLV